LTDKTNVKLYLTDLIKNGTDSPKSRDTYVSNLGRNAFSPRKYIEIGDGLL